MTNSGENDGSTCDLHLDAKIYGDVTEEMGWGEKYHLHVPCFWPIYSTYFIEMGREGYFSNANLFRSNF